MKSVLCVHLLNCLLHNQDCQESRQIRVDINALQSDSEYIVEKVSSNGKEMHV